MALIFNIPSIREQWRRAALVSLAVLVLAGVIVALVRTGGPGVTRTSHDASSSGAAQKSGLAYDSATPTTVAPATAAGSESAADSGGATASAPTSPPVASALTGPQIIRTADLQVRVKRGTFASAIDRATAVASGVGGFVADSSTSSFAKGQASGELTLRVPAARFDDVRKALARMGTLESVQLGGNDVGGQLVDLDARLRTLRAEEGSLDVILGKAADIGQILQVRDRLTGVRTQIEQLAGQQAALEDQVALATVHVSLHESGATVVKAKPHDGGTAFGDSLRTAGSAALAVLGGMVIVLGAVLPFLVLALLAWPFWRRYGRRQATAG
ncbi:MAG: hypothetical protein JWO68_2636 [Actinomycetia bacterium]|nr:hypothetical protein [Actinomycetes bacterium]